jgi:hypothetical protein
MLHRERSRLSSKPIEIWPLIWRSERVDRKCPKLNSPSPLKKFPNQQPHKSSTGKRQILLIDTPGLQEVGADGLATN